MFLPAAYISTIDWNIQELLFYIDFQAHLEFSVIITKSSQQWGPETVPLVVTWQFDLGLLRGNKPWKV